jgi:hypothetical protein
MKAPAYLTTRQLILRDWPEGLGQMTEPFYMTEGRGYWPDDDRVFWECPTCGQTNIDRQPIGALICTNCGQVRHTYFSRGEA